MERILGENPEGHPKKCYQKKWRGGAEYSYKPCSKGDLFECVLPMTGCFKNDYLFLNKVENHNAIAWAIR